MKVLRIEGDGGKLIDELKKKGSVIVIEKGETKEEKVVFGSHGVSFFLPKMNLRSVLEILADLGYEYAMLKGFSEEEVKNIGIVIPTLKNPEDLERAEECETLKSLIKKLKKLKDSELCGSFGIFVGFVRKIQNGREVVRLEYEKFDEFFERVKERIENQVMEIEGVRGVKIYHRVGTLVPGEDIVYVVVMSEHRKNLFEALKKAVELFKSELPVWKKEIYVDGEIWAHDRDLKKGS